MSNFFTQKIYLPAVKFRRSRRESMRSVYNAYREGLNFRRIGANWSEEQKRESILKQLRFAVRRAQKETVYYRELFRKIGFDAESDFSFEDFAKLPVLTRENIADNGEKMISENVPVHQRIKDSTGGSTGTPTQIWLGAEERGWKESGQEFAFEKIGIKAGARTAYFWGHHLDPQLTDSFKDKIRSFATNTYWFDCFRMSPEIFAKYHREFERIAPECVVAYAGALAQLAEFLSENNIEPKNYPQKCFVTGAEKLYPQHRALIEEIFGKPVHERYGGRDFGGLGIQVNPEKSSDYEIDWAWALVEPENDAKSESGILMTKLHADAMPMIRYRVGDVGKFSENARTGNPSFILKEVVGRDLDRLHTPDGKTISGTQLPHLLKDFAVREFTCRQAADYSVELLIVPKNGFDETQKSEISKVLQSNLPDLPIKVSVTEKIPRTKAGKLRPVISEVKK